LLTSLLTAGPGNQVRASIGRSPWWRGVEVGAARSRASIKRKPAPGYGLFPGSVGNTQQDSARFSSLYSGVVAKIFDRLPDATWVYPGHGGDTTLGAERPHLDEWRERGW
jgi:hypothetical protein